VSASVSVRLRRLVIQRAHGICEYCLIHQEDACFSFHIDHIVSRKQRGSTTSANLALSCLRCNVAKGTDPGTFIGRPPRLVRL
jgi:5-methylcytosine-specific restriction endonuclease McrA